MKNIYTNAAMWLAVGAAVVAAVVMTERIAPLWFFVIPFIVCIYERQGGRDV